MGGFLQVVCLVWGVLFLMALLIFFPPSFFLPFTLLSLSFTLLSFLLLFPNFITYIVTIFILFAHLFLPLNCNKDEDTHKQQLCCSAINSLGNSMKMFCSPCQLYIVCPYSQVIVNSTLGAVESSCHQKDNHLAIT